MNKEKELIEIKTKEDGTPAVSGRELYKFLSVKTDYNHWFPRMVEYGFTEGIDFNSVKNDEVRFEGKRQVIRHLDDHIMTIDMAKEISMIQRNEKGKQARQYFIKCERRLKEISSTTIPDMENIPDEFKPIFQLAKGVTMLAQKQVELAQRIDTLTAKTERIDEHLEFRKPDNGSMTLSDIAKELGVYSLAGLPHSSLVGAVARKCKIKVGTSHYHEDDKSQTIWTNESGRESLMLYIKPEGQDLIRHFFDESIADYYHDKLYIRNGRGHVSGDLNYHYVQFETGPEYKVKLENEL